MCRKGREPKVTKLKIATMSTHDRRVKGLLIRMVRRKVQE